jgi:hypothetical protein
MTDDPNGWPERRQATLEALHEADTTERAADLAVDFVLGVLAEALGMASFMAADGSETWDGDVAGTVYALLRDAGVLDDENRVARHAEVQAREAAVAAEMREACAKIVDAHAAAAKRCSEEGDVIYRIRAEFLATSYAISQAADDVRVTPLPAPDALARMLAAERRAGIEEAAKWHDEQANAAWESADGEAIGSKEREFHSCAARQHENYAAAIRARMEEGT